MKNKFNPHNSTHTAGSSIRHAKSGSGFRGKIAALFLLGSITAGNLSADEVVVYDLEHGPVPVLTAPDADPEVVAAADQLAIYLGRMTGAEFPRSEGLEAPGVVLGLPNQFPDEVFAASFDPDDLTRREEYRIQTKDGQLRLVGATPLAIRNAVWDLLHSLGYRYYFPSDNWEIVPELEAIRLNEDRFEAPDFLTRNFFVGMGFWGYNREPFSQWRERNRVISGVNLRTSHEYARIFIWLHRHYGEQPRFYALLDGTREYRGSGTKLNLADPEVRDKVVEYALEFFEQNPEADSISMDPSDGGGWSESEKSRAMGSVTDKVVTMANQVALAVEEAIGPRLVGIYAYGFHSPPPTIDVHPNVVVSVATSYLRGGYSVEELLELWGDKGVDIGIREYFSVHQWDRDLPGASRATRYDYIRDRIPWFKSRGAKFFTTELSDSWGPHGLGYYLASRLLWNVEEAETLDDQVEEFLALCFGEARRPMREFYQLIFLDETRRPLSEDLVGRMYRHLAEAWELSDDPAVRARLLDLIYYTRYVDLFRRYQQASGSDRQKLFEEVCRFSWRGRESQMVHVIGLFRDLPNRDRRVSFPEGVSWRDPDHPWKVEEPIGETELLDLLASGLEENQVLDFEMRDFSDNFVLVRTGEPGSGQREVRMRGANDLYFFVENAPATLELEVTGGLIQHYRDRGPARVELFPLEHELGESVAAGEAPPDGEPRKITLQTDYSGLHRLEVTDGNDMTRIAWGEDLPVGFRGRQEGFPRIHGRWNAWFFVPPETREVALFVSNPSGRIEDAGGQTLYDFESLEEPGYVVVPVPDGTSGSWWRMTACQGERILLNVPPWFFFAADTVWLPAEVVGPSQASLVPAEVP